MGRFFLCVHFFVCAISRKYLTVNDLQKSGRPKSLIYKGLQLSSKNFANRLTFRQIWSIV